MASRPSYFVKNGKVVRRDYEFQWFSGFAVSQKQKCINSLHSAVKLLDSSAVPLEVSTKSTVPLGVKLSAFNLRLNGHTLENIFQSSKVFQNGGPYCDLLEVSPKDAKRDQRLKISGRLVSFNYEERDFPLEPKTLFYDYIYLKALSQSVSAEEIQSLKNYSHFTDIEFNPERSINTQAKTVAVARLMLDMYGEIPEFTPEEFTVFHKMFVTA